MDADSLRTDLRAFIATNFLFDASAVVADDESLLEGGLIDSTGAMELISHVEGLIGVMVPDEDLTASNFDSIDRIVDFVGRLQAA